MGGVFNGVCRVIRHVIHSRGVNGGCARPGVSCRLRRERDALRRRDGRPRAGFQSQDEVLQHGVHPVPCHSGESRVHLVPGSFRSARYPFSRVSFDVASKVAHSSPPSYGSGLWKHLIKSPI